MIIALYLVTCYLAGSVLTAWFVGKWKGGDLRAERSGNLGARNAGTVLGKGAFLLTFLGDGGKGALIILLGRWLDLSPLWVSLGFLFAILGHLYPFWLKGKGGKGIATFVGASLAFNPFAFAYLAVVFLILFAILRSATLSMNIAFLVYPIYFLWIGKIDLFLIFSLIVGIILWRHYFDTQDSWNERWWRKKSS
ncbi:glycerol-3-phosphate acyltransferase [Chryseomicrobium palamuruense]|uniref:Glycerol-3-phosphate acyltransferase n=1 Tax=Chryseomicrobium palamuruense TaxID=682973 RepID=A0ABV8UU18_9BACL